MMALIELLRSMDTTSGWTTNYLILLYLEDKILTFIQGLNQTMPASKETGIALSNLLVLLYSILLQRERSLIYSIYRNVEILIQLVSRSRRSKAVHADNFSIKTYILVPVIGPSSFNSNSLSY